MSLVNQELDVAQNQSPDSELPIMSKNLINDITANVNEAEHALNKITTGKLSQETDEYIPLSATAYLVSQINDLERRNIQIQQNNVSIESRIEQHEETIRQYTAEMAKLTCLLEASKKLEVIYEKCLKLCGNDEKKATNLIYEVLKDATEKLVDNDTLLKYAEQAKRVRSSLRIRSGAAWPDMEKNLSPNLLTSLKCRFPDLDRMTGAFVRIERLNLSAKLD